MKKKKILKVATAVATLGVVAAISFSATFAYLTALTEQKTNTFSSQGVDISVNEGQKWDSSVEHKYVPGQAFDKAPAVDVNDGSQPAYVAAVLTYWKGITQADYNTATTNGTKTVDGYAKVGTDKYYKRIAPSDFDAIAETWYDDDHAINEQWEDRTGPTTANYLTYYYKGSNNTGELQIVDPNGGTEPLFNKVIFKDDLSAATLPRGQVSTTLSDIKIIVSAYAVRASSYSSFDLAKNELDRLIDGNIKSVIPTT